MDRRNVSNRTFKSASAFNCAMLSLLGDGPSPSGPAVWTEVHQVFGRFLGRGSVRTGTGGLTSMSATSPMNSVAQDFAENTGATSISAQTELRPTNES
jgi:hypothetical protein